MAENKKPLVQTSQVSLIGLFALMTFSALIIGVVTIAYQASTERRALRNELVELREKNAQLASKLRNEIGDGIRTKYAERLLFHVAGNRDQYTELSRALDNYDNRKVRISVSPLGDNDGLTYVNFYSSANSDSKPFCHSFLIREADFKVLDERCGEQSRTPRIHNGQWICGIGENNEDRWFVIEDGQLKDFTPESRLVNRKTTEMKFTKRPCPGSH